MTLFNQLIATGRVEWNYSNKPGWTLNSGDTSNRSMTDKVTFVPDPSFKPSPFPYTITNVVVALANLDADVSRGIRVDVSAANFYAANDGTDGGGFELTVATWYNSIVNGVAVQYFVYGAIGVS
jgi:hypothetical protein